MCGDAIERLKELPDKSINTCVTSPPYYGLRDYGIGDQIGLEETPDEYIDKLVEVFRQVKRVLRDDGILWVNIGDSYWGSGTRGFDFSKHVNSLDKSWLQKGNHGSVNSTTNLPKLVGNKGVYKNKDLIGIPWMLAFALRADGWYLRQDIIWAKNNPMPESVKDRCTRSHEYIFMLTKSRKYWFDHDAIQEPTVTYDNYIRDRDNTKLNNTTGSTKMGGLRGNQYKTRNKRDVWRVGVCSTVKEAHFAVFPKDLVEPCILAGSPEGGTVLDPFNGSGTTGIVAVNRNRNYIGIDLNPEYIDITRRRVDKECTGVVIMQ